MGFVTAFILGGALCLVFQALLMFTKIGVPNLLVGGLFVGGIATALGFSDMLAAWGGAGFSVMVVGAAQAIFNAMMALLQGVWLPIVVVVAIFASLIVLGLLAGVIYNATHPASEEAAN